MKVLYATAASVCVTVLLAAPCQGVAAAAADPPANLLAADMDTTMDSGTSPLTQGSTTTGGSQQIVSVGGDNALQLSDASDGTNLASYFYHRFSTGLLKDRINAVYSEPAGSPAEQFVLTFDLARTQASDKPVAKDIYARVSFGNFDNATVPQFPVPPVSLTTTAAYQNTSGALQPVSDTDIPQYRFTIVPNGGTRLVSTVELGFQVRVDTGGTDEAVAVDNLDVYDAGSVTDTAPPTAPTSLIAGTPGQNSVPLGWSPSTDDTGVTGYDVFRDGYQVASVSGSTTTAVVGGLMPGTGYDFTVRAKDAFGHVSAMSAPLHATTSAYVPDNPAPYPGTQQTRSQWLWDKTKAMKEEDGPINVAQYTAQLVDHENTTAALTKLDTLYKGYDYEEYKWLSRMYAYLMAGDQFSAAMLQDVATYFGQYSYKKLPQTENLRMSTYVTGYLVGQYLPGVADTDGTSGAALMAESKANIEEMVQQAVKDGWAEYESPEYTIMTYFGLNAIYQWSTDQELRTEAKTAMDVMWFEWANDWDDGYLVSSESRAKGDLASVGDPTWRPADHTALAWTYFGEHRAQEGVGESDNPAPDAYRPDLEYVGLLAWSGTAYQPPALAVRIGRMTDKSYTAYKTNLQNSSGDPTDIYRTSYVRPTWGLATEVQYRRTDEWLEDQPLDLRWQSDAADPLFRVSIDQGNAPVGNYDDPAEQRVMQDGPTALGVYKSSGDSTENYLNALFPDTGSIKERRQVDGWTVVDTGTMYFAFRTAQPATWYHQTPNDPSNKVKTTTQIHPTTTLSYSYDILRSQADTNGWVLETGDTSTYASLDAFATALTTRTRLDTSHIGDAEPRLVYHSLSGHDLDLTFDDPAQAPGATHLVDGKPIRYDAFKLFDTPWLQQDRQGTKFTARVGSQCVVYDFSDWSVTSRGPGGNGRRSGRGAKP
ncbi:fibronectin type III domain-containing protein [Actinacidiphila sp. bgisy145]|uniref:fibronectin type III domain-containing protein n=1 Tax=Actinacidiphila sp. bgisy145 TaxID=3413792 RepID=UPI003EBB3AC0